MFLDRFHSVQDGHVVISALQASQFAKEIAGDFNPIHDPDARRFCVPGDLLFAIVLARFGLSENMTFLPKKEILTLEELDRVCSTFVRQGVKKLRMTGGEPLAQKRCHQLLERLCDAGYSVSLETSGAIDVSAVDARVSRVVDLKTPDSGEVERNLWSNLEALTAHDQVKFVICSRQDYEWARDQVAARSLDDICDVLFSPSWGQQDPTELAEWLLADGVPARFQLQLHKLLWGDIPGK